MKFKQSYGCTSGRFGSASIKVALIPRNNVMRAVVAECPGDPMADNRASIGQVKPKLV